MQRHLPPPTISESDEVCIRGIYVRAFDNDLMAKLLTEEFENSISSPMQFECIGPDGKKLESLHKTPFWKAIDSILQHHGILNTKLDQRSAYIDFQQIHPIFQLRNWDTTISLAPDMTRKAWEAMAPALALASKFLTTPELQGFWYHLAFGEKTQLKSGRTYLAHSPIEADFAKSRLGFESLLADLSKKIHFYWSPSKVGDASPEGCFAGSLMDVVTWLNPKEGLAIEKRNAPCKGPQYFDGYIGLASGHLYHLLSPLSNARTDECAMLRTQFGIAKTLCHELCHAVYHYRGLGHPEAYVYLSDDMAEAGFSWSQNVLGADLFGHLQKIPHSEVNYFKCATWKSQLTFPKMHTVVDMRYVEAWFRKDTWARIDEVVQNNLLKLPSPAGLPGPVFWLVDRYTEEPSEGPCISTCLYRDRKVVYPNFAVQTVCERPEGLNPEEWFSEVSKLDTEKAVAAGFDKDIFGEHRGPYERLLQP